MLTPVKNIHSSSAVTIHLQIASVSNIISVVNRKFLCRFPCNFSSCNALSLHALALYMSLWHCSVVRDTSAIVIDHTGYSVIKIEGDHTLNASNDYIQWDVILVRLLLHMQGIIIIMCIYVSHHWSKCFIPWLCIVTLENIRYLILVLCFPTHVRAFLNGSLALVLKNWLTLIDATFVFVKQAPVLFKGIGHSLNPENSLVMWKFILSVFYLLLQFSCNSAWVHFV